MYFEYEGTFYFSEEDEKDILDRIEKGLTPEQAIEGWRYSLDDNEYYEAGNVTDQILSYILTKI